LPGFDPRSVPVVRVDSDLPAVPEAMQTAQALRQRFAHPPLWTPELLRERKFAQREPAHAAVLVPIVLRDQPTVLLTQRTLHLSTHSGQVAFPGGRSDPEDADAAATALREAQEEVGLAPEAVEVLGSLSTYVTGTSFIVTPVVGLVRPDCVLRPNPYEVAEVFEVPLAFLLNPANHRHHVFEWQGVRREWLSMPYEDGVHTRFIWGATAGMLRNFYRFMSA
jgi:8-oxo-dGTP pyrophosphatase MutT (NUDIX family)